MQNNGLLGHVLWLWAISLNTFGVQVLTYEHRVGIPLHLQESEAQRFRKGAAALELHLKSI